ncbi:AAA family ATPase, partial [archaeon]
KKGKKGKDEEAEAMPKLQGKTELTDAMSKLVQEFEEVWDGRDESDNFQQKHDVELGKSVVRPGVYEEIRMQVDEMLIMNLKKIKLQVAGAGKGKKGGKGKKKKGGKGKKNKGKKKKPLPGEKIAELKGLDADHMLSILIEYQLIVKPKPRTINSLIGEFNYLGSVHHNADRKDEGTWEPQDPSIAQLRQSITEYCILPNGSPDIKEKCKVQIKSVMLYGPAGSGKTHAVEAVAHELGALLIHLTPAKLRGQFGGKSGPTKLVHMVMTVARDPAMQPVVIYIDECEQFFTGGKKNKDKEGPSRFKKDLLLYKNQALGPEHRVVIIGTSKQPELGDTKDLKNFFDKFLFMPYPDYPSRVLIWRQYITQKIKDGLVFNDQLTLAAANNPVSGNANSVQKKPITEEEILLRTRLGMEKIDVSSLAHVSEGYSAGSIARAVRIVITNRRVTMLKLRPLANLDFIDAVAQQDVSYLDDRTTFLEFTKAITGLAERRKKVEAIVSGESLDKKKDKKGGGKKKK